MSVLGRGGEKCRNQGQIFAFHLSGTAGSTAKHCWTEQMRSELHFSLSPLGQDSHSEDCKALGCPLGSSSPTVGLVSSQHTLQASPGSSGRKL